MGSNPHQGDSAVKSMDSGILAHYASDSTTLAHALKITRRDSQVFGFTSADQNATIAGVVYNANPGLKVTSIVTSSGAAVGNMEITTIHDGTTFATSEILGGVWRNAAFQIFRYNHQSIGQGIDILLAGNLGEITIRENLLVIELRDLRQMLQQALGSLSSKQCRYRLGSSNKSAGGLCMKDVTGAPFKVSGTLTGVTSKQVFRDSARTEAADYFGEGMLTWTSGANSGLQAKVKSYASDGTFTLALPMLGTVAIGNTYNVVAGCRKRRDEDCVTKFNNVLNFGGEPDRPGVDALTKPVEQTV